MADLVVVTTRELSRERETIIEAMGAVIGEYYGEPTWMIERSEAAAAGALIFKWDEEDRQAELAAAGRTEFVEVHQPEEIYTRAAQRELAGRRDQGDPTVDFDGSDN